MNTPTPHIAAKQGEIAPSILLPGDPLRAKFIAENFLAGAKQFNATILPRQTCFCHGNRNGLSVYRNLFS